MRSLILLLGMTSAHAALGSPQGISIQGGSNEQRNAVARALEEIPAGLKDCGEDVTIRIGQFLDSYNVRTIYLNPRSDGLDATLLHEFAHHFHQTCPSGKSVESFLAFRYKTLKERWEASRLQKLFSTTLFDVGTELNMLEVSDPAYEEQCKAWEKRESRITDRLYRLYAGFGFPSRYRRDMHAAKDKEYFAVAVEMRVFDPQSFAMTFSEKERSWLDEHIPGLAALASKRAYPDLPK